ncbi:dynein light chain [Babesia ovis]|uniref:Dynein light chain 1, cytoplasmic n=1 Tax=Babesia ovis TaxID=5869 RepID=A0A9W5WU86_BABOV|nr:dynein light chain [Babesia ovis]
MVENDTAAGTRPETVVKHVDMDEPTRKLALELAAEAMEKFKIEKDIAAYIKKEFDKRFEPTWHCVVGRNFGSVPFLGRAHLKLGVDVVKDALCDGPYEHTVDSGSGDWGLDSVSDPVLKDGNQVLEHSNDSGLNDLLDVLVDTGLKEHGVGLVGLNQSPLDVRNNQLNEVVDLTGQIVLDQVTELCETLYAVKGKNSSTWK